MREEVEVKEKYVPVYLDNGKFYLLIPGYNLYPQSV